jgi:TonB family protein
MMRCWPAFAATLLAVPLASQASGQPPAPVPAPAVRPWQVDWGSYFCTLIRQPGEGRPFAAAFLTVPGTEDTELLLVPQGRARLPRRITHILVLPQGRRFEVTSRPQWRGDAEVLALTGLPYELRSELEGATELQLGVGGEVRLRIPVAQAGAAVAAHRRCTAETAQAWRIDEARLAALRERPNSTNGLGFRAADYPPRALWSRTQGRVVLRITVTADGRAGDCAVVATSGDAGIDERSCRVVMARARFRGALDAAGAPVAIPAIFTVTWRIPGVR